VGEIHYVYEETEFNFKLYVKRYVKLYVKRVVIVLDCHKTFNSVWFSYFQRKV